MSTSEHLGIACLFFLLITLLLLDATRCPEDHLLCKES